MIGPNHSGKARPAAGGIIRSWITCLRSISSRQDVDAAGAAAAHGGRARQTLPTPYHM